MFERFTEHARRVIVIAQAEARLLKHPHIGSEHILLGLVGEEDTVAHRVLTEKYQLSVQELRDTVKNFRPEGKEATTGQIPFTPNARKVCELSLREALSLGHNYIATEHVLLGLVRNPCLGATILLESGADAEDVRKQVWEGLVSEKASAHPEAPLQTLAEAADQLIRAIRDEGPHPAFHRGKMNAIRAEAPHVWRGIVAVMHARERELRQ